MNKRLEIERMEDRSMMTGVVHFDSGVLTINMDGGTWDHSLRVVQVAGNVHVSGNANLSHVQGLPAAAVREIIVNGTVQNDSIDLSNVDSYGFPALQQVTIRAGAGNDTVLGSQVHDVIFGGKGDDFIRALAGNDEIHGGKGNDTVMGGAGVDLLFGNRGNDRLYGCEHGYSDNDRDSIFGGRGYDTFGFNNRYTDLNDVYRGIERDCRYQGCV
ncbi:MAG: hypothetical protein R3C28_28440 [Pirellulaceae bacterium]